MERCSDQPRIGTLTAVEEEADGFVERARTLVLPQNPKSDRVITTLAGPGKGSGDELAPETSAPVGGVKVDGGDLSGVGHAVGISGRRQVAEADNWRRFARGLKPQG